MGRATLGKFATWALGDLGWRNVETVDCDNGGCSGQVRLSHFDCDLAFFAREQGDVVVVPEDGQDFRAVFALEDAQPHEECQARPSVFERDMCGGVATRVGNFPGSFDCRFAQILQRGKIGVGA